MYTGSACSLFGTSALYNGRRWSARTGRALHRLDHSMIFVLIAGTYAPIALLLLRPPTQIIVPIAIGATAALGIALRMIWLTAARRLIAATYVISSCAGISLLPIIANRAGIPVLTLVLGGALLYTAGAIVYARRRPDPAPATFGYHEVFHLLTIAAAAAHCTAIVLIIYSSHPVA
jgi:hemolysin III